MQLKINSVDPDALSVHTEYREFNTAESMLVAAVTIAASEIPLSKLQANIYDHNDERNDSFFKELHVDDASHGRLARLVVTHTKKSRTSELKTSTKDLITSVFQSIIEENPQLLDSKEDEPPSLHILAEAFMYDPVTRQRCSKSLDLKLSKVILKPISFLTSNPGTWSTLELRRISVSV